MKFTLSSDQISALIADGVAKALAAQGAAPQTAASPHFLPKGAKAAPSDLAPKDARIVAAFANRGFSVKLMNRAIRLSPMMSAPLRAGSIKAGLSVKDSAASKVCSTSAKPT
jgi:hypothetical protein